MKQPCPAPLESKRVVAKTAIGEFASDVISDPSSGEEKHEELLAVVRFIKNLCHALQNIFQSLKGLCSGN